MSSCLLHVPAPGSVIDSSINSDMLYFRLPASSQIPVPPFTYPAADPVSECFALLDDSDASRSALRSRLYTGLVGTLDCHQADGIPDLFKRMQAELELGRHAIGLFTYELGACLLQTQQSADDSPLAQILIFDRCEHLSSDAAALWLRKRAKKFKADSDHPAGVANQRSNVSEAEFAAAIARIHDYIEAGDTYQINYTFRLRFDAYGSLPALYSKLRARQPVPYGALIALPDGRAILSFSPELFIRHKHGLLTTKPMKGTAPAHGNASEDIAASRTLASDSKNRAENLMIVDLLRNDLSRIAVTGSVHVPALFEVNRYGDILQMTSTIEAQLDQRMTFTDIFRGVFPCGSITGAPKHRAMQIINELEQDRRGIYTGAIGWFDAPGPGRNIGDFCLSVPIRSLMLDAPGKDGVRTGEMGVGAGIVHDSKSDDEYEECLLKAAFLSGLPCDFDLFETMYATRAEGCRHLDLHIKRLAASALYFGFPFDEAVLRKIVGEACTALPGDSGHRVRLSLGKGGFKIQNSVLHSQTGPVRVIIAKKTMSSIDLFLRHKTTVRKRYDDSILEAEKQGAFDTLFFNTAGELTEGGRCNVFVKLSGRWYTPPLDAGILPGVMRSILLADPAWMAEQRSLTISDLRIAEQVVVTNALRGARTATVIWENEPIAD